MRGRVTEFAYSGDRLMAFGNELCEYDGMGNPKVYRNKECLWEKGRQLVNYDGVTFAYNGQGKRISKTVNGITTNYTYDSNGNLIKQSDGTNTLEFIYDNSGVVGVKHNGSATYIYRKNMQGDIIALLDSSGAVVVKYVYNAWGEHDVICTKEECSTVAKVNPFRYRGYYYDTEIKLYYLKTRYYDAQVGRFITIDDLSYIDPEHINGLNLYAYCGNNPVMRTDAEGTDWASLKNRIKIGATNLWNNFKRKVKDSWNGFVNGLFKLPERIGETIGAFFEDTSVSGGMGLGIGLMFNIFELFGLSAIYKADFFNIKIDGDGIHIGGAAEKSIGFIFLKIINKMWGIEEFIHYGDDNPVISDKNWEFSIGVGGYFIFGFNLGFSIDLNGVWRKLKNIWGTT